MKIAVNVCYAARLPQPLSNNHPDERFFVPSMSSETHYYVVRYVCCFRPDTWCYSSTSTDDKEANL